MYQSNSECLGHVQLKKRSCLRRATSSGNSRDLEKHCESTSNRTKCESLTSLMIFRNTLNLKKWLEVHSKYRAALCQKFFAVLLWNGENLFDVKVSKWDIFHYCHSNSIQSFWSLLEICKVDLLERILQMVLAMSETWFQNVGKHFFENQSLSQTINPRHHAHPSALSASDYLKFTPPALYQYKATFKIKLIRTTSLNWISVGKE